LVVIKEWSEEELQRHWRMFKALLEFWIAKNNYEPSSSISTSNSKGSTEKS